MNHVYRSVWNQSTATFVAASETAGRGARGTSTSATGMTLARFALTALTAALMTAFGSQAHALPVGGTVSAGAATIVNGPATTTINQTTPNAAINWNSFSIGSAEAVRFVQPSSSAVALNRVVGADPSNILGTLSANGKVFLINPNGILFGKGASVNVGGLVASTLNVSDGDFMAGRYKFSGSGGSVVNQGSIDANGGYVALLGANVSNQGTISARMGTVALAAGEAITLDVAGDGLINVAVDRGAVAALVDNGGMIRADGGQVVMTAQSAGHLLGTVVNHTGVIEAGSISQRNGIVRLEADTVHVAGTIAARGAAGETGGTVSITGATVDVAPTATIDAGGGAGGGVIAVGGGWQGTGSLAHATKVGVNAGAKLLANATDAGDGGTISVWSDGATKVAGTLEATGGVQGGAGGRIETSGHVLDVAGIAVKASAPHGAAGTWLLDPYNLTVSDTFPAVPLTPPGTFTSGPAGSVVNNSDINNVLNAGTSVILQTGGNLGDGNGNGDITVASPIAKTAGGNAGLTLNAAGSILVNAAITSTLGKLDVTLDANTVGSGGYVAVAAPITTFGGKLVIGGGSDPLAGNAFGILGQTIGVNVTAPLTTNGGDITIHGAGYAASTLNNAYGVGFSSAAVNAGGGNIFITGTGGGTGASVGDSGVFTSGTLGGISTNAAGTITIVGTGGGTAGGTGAGNYGVLLSAADPIQVANGAISITGTGGQSAGSSNIGIAQITSIASTGSGGIALNGTAGGTGSNAKGLLISGGIDAGGGMIALTGAGGPGTALTTTNAGNGVELSGINAQVKTAGAGTITINGTGNGSLAGTNAYGVNINAGAVVSAADGFVGITGTNASTGTGGLNGGVFISGAGSLVTTTGLGAIGITGTGGAFGNQSAGVSTPSTSPTIVAAGSGDITIVGNGAGTSTSPGVALSSAVQAGGGNITITGNGSVQGGGANNGIQVADVTTTGAGNIALIGTGHGTGASANIGITGSGDITTGSGNITLTGTGSVEVGAPRSSGIVLSGAHTVATSGEGNITLIGTANGSTLTVPSYGVSLNTGKTVSAQNGLISITGTNQTTNGGLLNTGVSVIDAGSGVKSTGTGGILINGIGGGSGTTNAQSVGVYWNVANAIQSLAGGNIDITGTGGGGSATSNSNYGVFAGGSPAVASLSANGGDIAITGTGGAYAGLSSDGITQSGAIINAGAGKISLTGTGGGLGNTSVGITSTGNITAGTGAISLTGRSSLLGTAPGSGNKGIFLNGNTIHTAGNGTITLDGTATGAGAGANSYGLQTSGAIVEGENGTIVMNGTNLSSGTGGSNQGISIQGAASAIRSLGSGLITATGFGGGTGAGNFNYGITWGGVSNGFQATTGAISITGFGGGSNGTGQQNFGVSSGALNGTGGAISITGTGGNSSGVGNYGIYQGPFTALANTGSGSITLNGTGGGIGSIERGLVITSSVTTGTGNISLTGTGSPTATGDGSHGVYFNAGNNAVINVRTSGNGTITIDGTATSTIAGVPTAGATTYGVSIAPTTGNPLPGTTVISAADGLISVTGRNTAAGTGDYYGGVRISGDNGTLTSKIVSTGSGGVTVVGSGGGTGASSNDYGVFWDVANAIQSTGSGTVNIIGTGGGGESGTGTGNHGVFGAAALTGNGGGPISITGTAGGLADVNNYGITLTSVDAGTGTLTLTSTGATFISGALKAAQLDLLGSGVGYVLTNTGNAVGVLAGNAGSVNYAQDGDFVIGAVDSTQGLTSSGTVTLASNGAVTSTAPVKATALELLGSGSYVLVDRGNAAATLAANAGSVSYAQTGDLVIGMAGSTGGVTSSGTVLVNVIGNLTLANSVSATGGGAALQLVDTGSFMNRFGDSALSVTGDGRWLVWSTSPAADDRGGLVYAFKQYGATYGVTPVAGTGNGFLYSIDGVASVALVGPITKTYDGTTTAPLMTANFVVTAIDDDTVTVNFPPTGTYDTIDVGTGKVVTATGLTVSATNGTAPVYGYAIADAVAAVGTITPRPITVTADPQSRSYGDANPLFTQQVTAGSLVFSDAISGLATSPATPASHVGNYAIQQGTVTAGSNYALSFIDGVLAVTPASLVVSAADQGKTYGQTPTLTGFTANGLRNADTIGSVTETSAGSAATAGVGPYAIALSKATGGTFDAANYTIAYVDGVLTVTPASLTVTAGNATKTYGQTPSLTGFTSTTLQNGETIGSVTETSTGSSAGAGVAAGPYAIIASNAIGGTFDPSNYTIAYVNGLLTVTPASLTVTASNASKTYGQTPSLTGFTSTALQNGESIGSVTNTSAGTSAGAGVAAGPYAITASNASGGTFDASNYTIAYVPGMLTVGKATLTLTATPTSIAPGSAIPRLGGSVSGFVNGESQGAVTTGTLAFDTPATSSSGIGSYAIDGSGLTPNANYAIVQAPSNATGLTITTSVPPTNPVVAAAPVGVRGAIADALATALGDDYEPASPIPSGSSRTVPNVCDKSAGAVVGLNLTVLDRGMRLPVGVDGCGGSSDRVERTRAISAR